MLLTFIPRAGKQAIKDKKYLAKRLQNHTGWRTSEADLYDPDTVADLNYVDLRVWNPRNLAKSTIEEGANFKSATFLCVDNDAAHPINTRALSKYKRVVIPSMTPGNEHILLILEQPITDYQEYLRAYKQLAAAKLTDPGYIHTTGLCFCGCRQDAAPQLIEGAYYDVSEHTEGAYYDVSEHTEGAVSETVHACTYALESAYRYIDGTPTQVYPDDYSVQWDNTLFEHIRATVQHYVKERTPLQTKKCQAAISKLPWYNTIFEWVHYAFPAWDIDDSQLELKIINATIHRSKLLREHEVDSLERYESADAFIDAMEAQGYFLTHSGRSVCFTYIDPYTKETIQKNTVLGGLSAASFRAGDRYDNHQNKVVPNYRPAYEILMCAPPNRIRKLVVNDHLPHGFSPGYYNLFYFYKPDMYEEEGVESSEGFIKGMPKWAKFERSLELLRWSSSGTYKEWGALKRNLLEKDAQIICHNNTGVRSLILHSKATQQGKGLHARLLQHIIDNYEGGGLPDRWDTKQKNSTHVQYNTEFTQSFSNVENIQTTFTCYDEIENFHAENKLKAMSSSGSKVFNIKYGAMYQVDVSSTNQINSNADMPVYIVKPYLQSRFICIDLQPTGSKDRPSLAAYKDSPCMFENEEAHNAWVEELKDEWYQKDPDGVPCYARVMHTLFRHLLGASLYNTIYAGKSFNESPLVITELQVSLNRVIKDEGRDVAEVFRNGYLSEAFKRKVREQGFFTTVDVSQEMLSRNEDMVVNPQRLGRIKIGLEAMGFKVLNRHGVVFQVPGRRVGKSYEVDYEAYRMLTGCPPDFTFETDEPAATGTGGARAPAQTRDDLATQIEELKTKLQYLQYLQTTQGVAE